MQNVIIAALCKIAKLELKWRRGIAIVKSRSRHRKWRIRSFCTFGGDDYRFIGLVARGDTKEYAHVLEVMDGLTKETLGEY